jgi:capsule polysaccharide modification protein KpsS
LTNIFVQVSSIHGFGYNAGHHFFSNFYRLPRHHVRLTGSCLMAPWMRSGRITYEAPFRQKMRMLQLETETSCPW